jgi:hypothetical protein
MKKSILSLTICLFVFISLVSCASDDKKATFLELEGEIKGLKKGTLYIQMLTDSSLTVVDSILFDGKSTFSWKHPLEGPEMMYLFLDRGITESVDNLLLVFAEPGKMTLKTDLEKFYGNALITGSENHDLWVKYQKSMQRLNNENVSLIEANFKAIREKNAAKIDSIERRQEMILKRKYLQTINFALTHKDKDIAPYLAVSEIFDAQKRFLDSIYSALTPEVKDGKYGKILAEEVNKRTE